MSLSRCISRGEGKTQAFDSWTRGLYLGQLISIFGSYGDPGHFCVTGRGPSGGKRVASPACSRSFSGPNDIRKG